MLRQSQINIGIVDSDVLGVHGDNGNALVLQRRAQWRGIDADVHRISVSESIPSSLDIYVMGAATRQGRQASLEHLQRARGLSRALLRGTPLLAIMTSMHSLCDWFIDEDGDKVAGLGILDVRSVITPHLMSFPLVTQPLIAGVDELLIGHESHAGITDIGPNAQPLGRVIYGSGNALLPGQMLPIERGSTQAEELWEDFEPLRYGPLIVRFDKESPVIYEGAVQDNIIASYMHGPILARNPQLADLILERVLGEKLAPLELESVTRLREARLHDLGISEGDIPC